VSRPIPSIPISLRWLLLILCSLMLAACGSRAVRKEPLSERQAAASNAVLFRAIGLVGTPYRWGGNTPESGFDCSGLVGYVFRDAAGVSLPRTADAIGEMDIPKVPRDRLQPGDLVFFTHKGRGVGHIGIYVGEGRFVHAPNEGGVVRLDYLDGAYWKDHYAGARRALR
jgi:cell wall-associated NlpC family hydrolase